MTSNSFASPEKNNRFTFPLARKVFISLCDFRSGRSSEDVLLLHKSLASKPKAFFAPTHTVSIFVTRNTRAFFTAPTDSHPVTTNRWNPDEVRYAPASPNTVFVCKRVSHALAAASAVSMVGVGSTRKTPGPVRVTTNPNDSWS